MIERRTGDRARINVTSEVRAANCAWEKAELEDLSCSGFRMRWKPRYQVDSEFSIRFPGLELLRARVCWHDDRRIGCEFTKPLSDFVFDHIAAQYQN
jgi:hypothetical protein